MLILLNNFESLGKTSEIVNRTMYAEYLTSNQSVVAVPVLT